MLMTTAGVRLVPVRKHSTAMRRSARRILCLLSTCVTICVLGYGSATLAADAGFESFSFVNFESAHVYPLDLTPDGQTLLAVNTAANRLMVFDVSSGEPVQTASIPVGLDPVSVRARSNTQAWVANHVSDTVSVVDLNSHSVIATLQTEDEPADIVFAGTPQRAFVSASQANRINVFNPNDLSAPRQSIFVNGEDPRALAVSADGQTVYAAFFESSNSTTVVAGGKSAGGRLGEAVTLPDGPYGGRLPPNNGDSFSPPINPNLPTPGIPSMIVRKDDSGNWIDDNGGDWTRFISGDMAETTRRVQGWDLPDRDIAIIDANTFDVRYQYRLMNIQMAMAVNPANGQVTVVGTDATNEIRFEPVLNGRFLRVNMARFTEGGSNVIDDLNPHLDYSGSSIPQSQRDLSIGDPRGVTWNAQGSRAWVTGMGSNNVVLVDTSGNRTGRIEVGQGPTGIVLNEPLNRAFVLNKFDASISSIAIDTLSETGRTDYFDPTPGVIRNGRPHLYGTHASSGLGHIACASCHIDGRSDRLAWDLGNPAGEMKTRVNTRGTTIAFHPMKGPMKTQSLIDIIGVPAMHHSGDSDDLFDFAGAFKNLQGADQPLNNFSMTLFEAMLDTVHLMPNPYRNIDNSLSSRVALPGPNGTTRTVANAVTGKRAFFTGEGTTSTCASCHLGPRSRGDVLNNKVIGSPGFVSTVPLLAETFTGTYERFGWWARSTSGSNAGFGFRPDGAQSSEMEHVGRNLPLRTESGVDVIAYLMSIEGPQADVPGLSRDSHAGVGQQVTLSGDSAERTRLEQLIRIANSGNVGLVASGPYGNMTRGFMYIGNDSFQSDQLTEVVSLGELIASAADNGAITFTLVPIGSEYRIGIDSDEDGQLNRDEMNAQTDPESGVDGNWTHCASEGGRCRFSGRATLRFGDGEQYLYRVATNGANCNTATFGDSGTGGRKTCEISDNLIIHALNINFQDSSDAPSNYLPDRGDRYAARNGLSYGWNVDHRSLSRERSANADQRLDTLVHFDTNGFWEIALPNNTYEVTVSVGDAGFGSTHTINVEGQSYWNNFALAANQFASETRRVTVADGKLTIDSGASPRKRTRINYVQISEVATCLVSDPTCDFDQDGVVNANDAFPANPAEQLDSDGDGVGDNSDAFANDASESEDSDADGVGDNADAFPYNARESIDSDGDGVGDNSDAFPNDASRSSIEPVVGGPIDIDGLLNDWTGIDSFGIDAEDITGETNPLDWKQAWMTHDENHLYIAYEHYRAVTPSWGQTMYIDTDVNDTTGFQIGMAIGADYVLQSDFLYRYTGDGSNWQWEFVAQAVSGFTDTVSELRIDQESIGHPVELRVTFVGGNTAYEGGTAEDLYPDGVFNTSAQQRFFVYRNTTPDNSAPVAQDQLVNTEPGVATSFTLGATDVNGDILSYEIVSGVSHGLITGTAPNLVYTPSTGFIGTDWLGFRVNDGQTSSAVAVVQVVVAEDNRFDMSNSASDIALDGTLMDWAGLNSYALDAAEIEDSPSLIDWREAWIAHDENSLYFAYRFQNANAATVSPWSINAFIDADQDINTGYVAGAAIGADFLLQGSILYKHSGKDENDWLWTEVSAVPSTSLGAITELSLARDWLGNPQSFDVFFAGDNLSLGGSQIDYYPDAVYDDDAAVRFFSYSIGATQSQSDTPTISAAQDATPSFSRQARVDRNEGDDTAEVTVGSGALGPWQLIMLTVLLALSRLARIHQRIAMWRNVIAG